MDSSSFKLNVIEFRRFKKNEDNTRATLYSFSWNACSHQIALKKSKKKMNNFCKNMLIIHLIVFLSLNLKIFNN